MGAAQMLLPENAVLDIIDLADIHLHAPLTSGGYYYTNPISTRISIIFLSQHTLRQW